MKRLQDSVFKINSLEVKTLESFYSNGQTKAGKKLKLLNILTSGKKLSEKEVIKDLYGESENGKNNFRKLLYRLETDLENVAKIRKSQKETSVSSNMTPSADLFNQVSSYSNKIEAKFDFLESDADENRSFLNQIHIGRLRSEALYFQECPFHSLNKLREAHRFASYLTESKIFYLGVKHHFVNGCSDKETLIKLDKFKELSAGYFEESDEPRIGFYYHMGTIVLNFLKEDHIPFCHHVDKLLNLIRNNSYLNSKEYADEIILFRFLATTYSGNKKKSALDNLSVPVELILSNNFIIRNKNKPFKLELLIRLCLNLGYAEKALQIARMAKRNKLFSSHTAISRKWDFFELLAYYMSGDLYKARTSLNKLNTYRNGLGVMKFYFPVIKFILNQPSIYRQHEVEIESYKKMIYRYIQKIEDVSRISPALKRVREQLLVLKQIIESEALSYEDCIKYKQQLTSGVHHLWGSAKKTHFSADGIITLEYWLDQQMKAISRS